MSKGDLISREEAEKAISIYANPNIDGEAVLSHVPSADIKECARALKEHCNEHLRKPHTLCDDCPMFEGVCRRFNVVPRWWDLPEGEKGGDV